MTDHRKYKISVEKDREYSQQMLQASNPLAAKINTSNIAISDYSKEIPRPKYDKDILEIVEKH